MGVQPRRHHCSSSSLLALNHLYRIIPTKMSETEVKTDAPTAEEIKGTKRTAEEEVDAAKKQKTERAKKTSTKKPKEKRVKKRKTVRARRKRKEMIKNFVKFLLSPNLVISYYIYQIRHLIISALEIKQEEIDCVSSKKNPIQRAKCQTNPYQ